MQIITIVKASEHPDIIIGRWFSCFLEQGISVDQEAIKIIKPVSSEEYLELLHERGILNIQEWVKLRPKANTFSFV